MVPDQGKGQRMQTQTFKVNGLHDAIATRMGVPSSSLEYEDRSPRGGSESTHHR